MAYHLHVCNLLGGMLTAQYLLHEHEASDTRSRLDQRE